MRRLDAPLAETFARVALANVEREYPHRLDHLIVRPPGDLRPSATHPAFYGSYDWHSCVHMHWLLVRVLRLFPGLAAAPDIRRVLSEHLQPDRIAAEVAFFRGPGGATFERPYGWAWLLELAAELRRSGEDAWRAALEPLDSLIAERFVRYLEACRYPVRAGTHGNSAFACLLGLDYALEAEDAPLAAAIEASAKRWFRSDLEAPLLYEPSQDEFLSPALCEAALMALVMDERGFEFWFSRFMPHGIGPLGVPPVVGDRSDPKLVHLDGLCLSRAWLLKRLAGSVDRALRPFLNEAAEVHLEAAVPHVVGGDYVGEHWLATFAVLGLGEG